MHKPPTIPNWILLFTLILPNFLFAQASSDQQTALRMYHLGNSLTDELLYQPFQGLVETQGKTRIWGRQMIPGAPLEWIWKHPNDGFKKPPFGGYANALKQFSWDALLIQPFDRSIESDALHANRFWQLALKVNPETQLYIYTQWPHKDDGPWEQQWLATGFEEGTSWQQPGVIQSRDFHERLAAKLSNMNPQVKPVRIVPNGEVMYRLKQKIDAGKVPGLNSIYDLYEDDLHLKDSGSYLVACTVYATLYQADPRSLDSRGYDVEKALAATIRQTAWEVVSTYPPAGWKQP